MSFSPIQKRVNYTLVGALPLEFERSALCNRILSASFIQKLFTSFLNIKGLHRSSKDRWPFYRNSHICFFTISLNSVNDQKQTARIFIVYFTFNFWLFFIPLSILIIIHILSIHFVVVVIQQCSIVVYTSCSFMSQSNRVFANKNVIQW